MMTCRSSACTRVNSKSKLQSLSPGEASLPPLILVHSGSHFPADMYFTNRTIIIAAMLEDAGAAVRMANLQSHLRSLILSLGPSVIARCLLQDLERNFQLPDKGLQANIKGLRYQNPVQKGDLRQHLPKQLKQILEDCGMNGMTGLQLQEVDLPDEFDVEIGQTQAQLQDGLAQ